MTTTPQRLRTSAVALAGVVLTAVTLAGCGSSSSTTAKDPAGDPPSSQSNPSSPGDSPSSAGSPTGPSCAKVWKKGATLPADYRGCHAATGWVKPQVYQCEDGHKLVTYAHLYYAAPRRTISRAATTLARDHAFRHVMAVCGA